MLRDVLRHYRASLTRIAPLLLIHVVTRLAVAGLITPLIALVLAIVLHFVGQHALTDQDIARFLLSPGGMVGGLLIASLALTASVLDLAMMIPALRGHNSSPLDVLRQAAGMLLPKLYKLVLLAAALVMRVMLYSLPFVAAAGAIAWGAMTEYDINYYLTLRPVGFMVASAVIAVLALSLVAVLLARLSGWAIALHLVLLKSRWPKAAFTESARLLEGRRWMIVRQLAIWLVLRTILFGAIFALLGVALRFLPGLFGEDLRRIAIGLAVLMVVWAALLAVTGACANGALASLLTVEYERVAGDEHTFAPVAERVSPLVVPLFVAAATFLVIVAAIQGARLLDQVAQERTVEIIAHRGAAADRPENTMAAIRKAIEDKADWVEIDVQENAEGEIVVAHDSDFMKQAGVPTKVWDATAVDIAETDIGSWYDPVYAAERAPYLRDVLSEAKGRAKLIIELKYYGHDKNLEDRVARLVEDAGMTDQVAIMSLKLPGISKMRSLRPGWRTGVLAATAIGDLAKLDTDFLALNTGQVSVQLIKRAEEAGKSVYAWTVDDPVTMSRLISMGVDGLITNKPALARQTMERRNALSTAERLILWIADQFGLGKHRLSAAEDDA